MLLERTISQLDIGHIAPDAALDLGRLGFLQWLGALPGAANYVDQAERALALAAPFRDTSPAISVFCALIEVSLTDPLVPLPLAMPPRDRRGGARARRAVL